MFRYIDTARPQVGHEELVSTKNIKGEITITIVIAMKESLFLMTVQRIIGGIKVQYDFFRRLLMRGNELLNENLGHSGKALPGDSVFQSA